MRGPGAQMIGRDNDRALGIEKADHVVVIGDAAAQTKLLSIDALRVQG
jgi:hypothetical protein